MDNSKFTNLDPKQDLVDLINIELVKGETSFNINDFTYGLPISIKDAKYNTAIELTSRRKDYIGTKVLKYNRINLKDAALSFAISNNTDSLDLTNQDVKAHFLTALPYAFDTETDIHLPATINLTGQVSNVKINAASLRYIPGDITLLAFKEEIQAGKLAIKSISPFYNKNGGPQLNTLNVQLFSNDCLDTDAFTKSDLKANKQSKLVFNFGLDGTGLWDNFDDFESTFNVFKMDRDEMRKLTHINNRNLPAYVPVVQLIKEQNYKSTLPVWVWQNIYDNCRINGEKRLKQSDINYKTKPYFVTGNGVHYVQFGANSYSHKVDGKIEYRYESWRNFTSNDVIFPKEQWVNEYDSASELRENEQITAKDYCENPRYAFVIPFKDM